MDPNLPFDTRFVYNVGACIAYWDESNPSHRQQSTQEDIFPYTSRSPAAYSYDLFTSPPQLNGVEQEPYSWHLPWQYELAYSASGSDSQQSVHDAKLVGYPVAMSLQTGYNTRARAKALQGLNDTPTRWPGEEDTTEPISTPEDSEVSEKSINSSNSTSPVLNAKRHVRRID